ncbi:MAG: hypothetical protein DDT41_01558 [candidate division WS2 bacterium]|nr:hypothetical protein [Candidatus Psychracetigena formicireducens]
MKTDLRSFLIYLKVAGKKTTPHEIPYPHILLRKAERWVLEFCDIQSECMKKLAYEKALFLIIGILVLPSLAQADDFTVSGYSEVGRRSTAEDYEEEDTDEDYTYQN